MTLGHTSLNWGSTGDDLSNPCPQACGGRGGIRCFWCESAVVGCMVQRVRSDHS